MKFNKHVSKYLVRLTKYFNKYAYFSIMSREMNRDFNLLYTLQYLIYSTHITLSEIPYRNLNYMAKIFELI